MGILLPIMGSMTIEDTLGSTLFGKTRKLLLALLYTHADEAFYLEQLIKLAGVGRGTVQRELQALSAAGIAKRTVRGRQVYYQADADCPIFAELKAIVAKTAGVVEILRGALAPIAAQIRCAFVFGSIARGTERQSSDVDVMIIGDVSFADAAAALATSQNALGREVNPNVYPPDELRAKLQQRNHFLKTVLKGDKLFLIGDEHELARLAR